MATGQYGIGELAAAAGVSRRAVRFYVQRGLLPPPHGAGRGSHYDASHLAVLRKIGEMQVSGIPLEAIRQVVAPGTASPARPEKIAPPTGRAIDSDASTVGTASKGRTPAGKTRRKTSRAAAWVHLVVAEGVEIHLDLARHHRDPTLLRRLSEAAWKALAGTDRHDNSPDVR